MDFLRDLRVWAAIVTLALGASLIFTRFQVPAPPPKVVQQEDVAPAPKTEIATKPEATKEKAEEKTKPSKGRPEEKTEEAKPNQPKAKTGPQPKVWQVDCDVPKTREEATYCQQRRLADAAERTEEAAREQVQLAREQFWLLVIGFAGLLIALYLIREAIKGR
jgi:cytoskeletal protein RodZ